MIDLTGYKQISRDYVAKWYAKQDVYCFVFRQNKYVNVGFYNMRKIPLIYRNAMVDLLTNDNAIFMVEEGA